MLGETAFCATIKQTIVCLFNLNIRLRIVMKITHQFILKIHAVFLMILPILLTINGFVGMTTKMGVFGWLHDNPMVLVGLMQAYLLMMLIGVSMWLGAKEPRAWRWSVIAIVAHRIPLLTIFALWNVLADGGHLSTVNYSYVIHGVWIAIETISLLITARNHRNGSNLFST